jgi:hypothetical protein
MARGELGTVAEAITVGRLLGLDIALGLTTAVAVGGTLLRLREKKVPATIELATIDPPIIMARLLLVGFGW